MSAPAGQDGKDEATARARADARGQLRVLGVDPELGFAGGETQVMGLALELRRAGHDVELACDPRGRLFRCAGAAGLVCHPLGIRNAIDLRAGMRLRALLARGGYDVVHFHTARAHAMAPFARGRARALVVTRRMDYRPNRVFAPYLYNHAVDGVAAISERAAQALAEAGADRARITVIPSGVDCERFAPPSAAARAAARERLGLKPDDLAVGAVGMLEERKGHRYLLKAVASLARGGRASAPPRCLIAGAGPLGQELLDLCARLGISRLVTLLGLVEDARTLLEALDIFAFPSIKEGLGVALLEAMAAGLPVVASRAGGVGEVVEDGRSGILTPPGDASAIAAALATLAGDRGRAQRFGAEARARACRRFSMAAMARETVTLYRACLARRAGSAGGGTANA